MRNILTNIRSSQVPVPTYEAETIAYMTAIGIPNDSATYYSTLKNSDVWDIIDTYVKAEKANGSFQFFDYPMIGNTAAQHSYNLVDTSKFQITWSGGWIHSELGAKGNGTNTYGTTGFVPDDEQDVYSNGLSYVSGTDLDEIKATVVPIGTTIGGSSSFIIANKSASPSIRTRMNNNYINGSISTNSGVVTSVKQSNALTKIFKDGSQLGSGNSGGLLNPYEVIIGTNGLNGTPSDTYTSIQRFQGFKAHIGLTDTQVAQHHANVDAREAALLRKTW